MMKSMTGYGSKKIVLDGREISFEIKSVNHRYFDFSCRIARAYSFLEDSIKRLVQENITRGKVDVAVSVHVIDDESTDISLNTGVLKSYIAVLTRLRDEYCLSDDISVMSVAQNPEIFNVVKEDEDQEALWQGVKQAADEAIAVFVAMRSAEGRKLCDDLMERSAYIRRCADEIAQYSKQAEADYREKITQRMMELLGESNLDEARIISEAALFADKINTTEELVRLKSHMEQFEQMMHDTKPVGRKMDFLIQEMNREINTVGSKSNRLEIARLVVDVKSEIEKIREQVQNIE